MALAKFSFSPKMKFNFIKKHKSLDNKVRMNIIDGEIAFTMNDVELGRFITEDLNLINRYRFHKVLPGLTEEQASMLKKFDFLMSKMEEHKKNSREWMIFLIGAILGGIFSVYLLYPDSY